MRCFFLVAIILSLVNEYPVLISPLHSLSTIHVNHILQFPGAIGGFQNNNVIHAMLGTISMSWFLIEHDICFGIEHVRPIGIGSIIWTTVFNYGPRINWICIVLYVYYIWVCVSGWMAAAISITLCSGIDFT